MSTLTLLSALLATVAAAAAAMAMAAEYRRSRRPHAACWTISLGLFALSSATLAAGQALGWSPALFKLYYLVGGVLTVPWMALGAVFLFGPPRLGQVGLWTTIGLTVVAICVTLAMPAHITDTSTLPELKVAVEGWTLAPLARALAAVANAGGTPIAIYLLLRAASIYRRKKVLPNKASGAIIISIGIGAAAVGGVLAAVESVAYLAPALALGAVLMLIGFQRWNRTPQMNTKLSEVPT